GARVLRGSFPERSDLSRRRGADRRAPTPHVTTMSRGLRQNSWEPDLEPLNRSPESGRSWLWRLLYILYSLEVGVFLLFLPWLHIWDNNYLLYRYPNLRPFISNSYVKGAVLGLGLVNIFIGIQEIGLSRRRSRRL